VLAGDHCKSASDLGVPFIGVGLLYRYGYFRQTVDADGYQQHSYTEYDFTRLPVRPVARRTGQQLVVSVPFPDREVTAKVWVATVGRVNLLLLDTGTEENDPADRPITHSLYVRGREMRLAQELILGIGGARALAALGIEPAVWHVNEGHSALLQLERLRAAALEEGAALEDGLPVLSRNTVFTTHTPVPAGHESFERTLAQHYLEPWTKMLRTPVERLLALGNADHGESEQPFNLTALALRSSSFRNGVSRINATVSDAMWRHISNPQQRPEDAIQAITNGVHLATWVGAEIRGLLGKWLGEDWEEAQLDERRWEAALTIADDELWAAHRAQKERLGRFLRGRLLQQLARHGHSPDELRRVSLLFDPEVLTLGFARRFATYKRAQLVFSDMHRLRAHLCHRERPIQLIFAGKAHPADRPGQELIQHIFRLSQTPDLLGRVFFLENYDMRVGAMLTQGCDVWLNTPRPPHEASGTSGQKAGINGVLNCSILDGWWPEAFDGSNGWAIGDGPRQVDDWRQDQEDAQALYEVLEQFIVPTYYERDENGLPRSWVARMKRSIQSIGAHFSSHRMMRDYVERAYAPRMPGAGTSS
jgi:starch phosphorylase